MTAADYRRQADEWRSMAGDFHLIGEHDQARMAEFWAAVRDDAAHLLDLDPSRTIDLEAIAAARNDRPTLIPTEADGVHLVRAERIAPVVGTKVELAEMLTRAEEFVGRFVAFQTDAQHVAVTLWIAHTYAAEAAYCTPRLAIQSAEKQSGKTRLLEVLDLVTCNPKQVANISEAALFRTIDKGSVTILFDETDAIFGPKASKDHEDLRALLNMGYRRGATVPRCVGPKQEVHDFSTFAPVALAGIGSLPDTIEDRSIIIRLRRRASHERVEKLRQRMIEPEAAELRGDLDAVLRPLVPILTAHIPEQPPGLADRAEDIWEPLFAIAELAGADWATRARDAAVRLSDQEPEDGSVTERLLSDIRTAFGEKDRIASVELCEQLANIEEAPWGDWYGKPIEQRGLAKLLKHHRIKPHQLKIDSRNVRGYERSMFEDAFDRYLAPVAATPDTALPALSSKANGSSGVAPVAVTEPVSDDEVQILLADAFDATVIEEPKP